MTATAQSTNAKRMQTNGARKHPGPEQRRLDVLVGSWKMEGQQYEGDAGSAAKIRAEETFEWLPGGMFLVHRLVGRIGDAEMACIEIIESDRAAGRYRMHTFYNDGNAQDWQLAEQDGGWLITGDWPMPDGSKRHVRCTQRFEKGDELRTAKWESSEDGTRWTTFWDTTSTRKDG